MPFTTDPNDVEALVGALLGGIDVSGGPTQEQLRVLDAIARRVWRRGDLDLATIERLDPDSAADRLRSPIARRHFHEIHVALESCRHPQTLEQVELVERYAAAMGVGGPDLPLFRTFIEHGTERAAADYDRFLADLIDERAEPSLGSAPPTAEPELVARLEAFADLPDDSLGRAFLAFYGRTGLSLPGTTASPLNHFFVSHDMTHVIAGISTTAEGEVALSAFQLGMGDNEINAGALLASLIAHEAGFGSPGTFAPESETLASDVAAELLADELARGSGCTDDFSLVDHFALAPLPLAEVRALFGVEAPSRPDDDHHCWSLAGARTMP